jgi:hypothetical protein
MLSDVYKPKVDADDLAASLDDIWFQVDPFVDRIAFKPPSGAPEKSADVSVDSFSPVPIDGYNLLISNSGNTCIPTIRLPRPYPQRTHLVNYKNQHGGNVLYSGSI